MKRSRKVWIALAVLAPPHLLVVFAGFLAPYDFAEQHRALPYAPPTRLHFFDGQGKLHLRPFVYPWADRPGNFRAYEQDQRQAYPIRFVVYGVKREVAGVPSSLHLFGVEQPARIFLLGTDSYGRDQFSRFLYGGRISLLAGWLAAGISLALGALLGCLSGFYGGRVDQLFMRGGELFLALPWLYLLFAVRAFLPLQISAPKAFFLVVAVIGLIGWARPARLIRGVVLSAKQRNYVLAARGFGASDLYLLRRHILPQTFGVLLTQGALLVPQFILAEVTLSFLGLGIGEPVPSWGNLLASLQQYHVLASYWWMYVPALAFIPLFLGYQLLGELLQERARVVVV